MHFDGESWTSIPLPDLDRPCPSLFKVWGQHRDSLYFVGANGVLLHWNGESIEQISVEIGDDLVAVWGNEQHVVAVGGRIRGVILHSDGNEWQTRLGLRVTGCGLQAARCKKAAHGTDLY